MPADLEQLGALVVLATEACEPGCAAAQDRRHDRDRFDIVDRGRAAIKPGTRRERRLEPWLALLALEALDHRGFFAADIGARAAMDEHVEIIARLGGILADQSGLIGLVDRRLQHFGLADIFAADIDIGGTRAHCETGDQRALDQLVRIVAQDLAVLAAARLGFVGIDDQETRTAVLRFLGHEAPLHAGGEARTTASAQARCLDFVNDPVLTPGDQVLGLVPIAARFGRLQVPGLEPVDIGEDAILVSETHD